MPTSLPCRLIALTAALVLTSGCGRSPDAAASTAKPSAAAKSTAAAQPAATPAQRARERFNQKVYSQTLQLLGDDRSLDALDVCLEMLTIDAQHIVHRVKAVELLEHWPDQHDVVAEALTQHLERAFWAKELEAIARVIAKWGVPDHAVQYARYFVGQRDPGLMKGAAAGLEHLMSAHTVPVLLAALPDTPPEDRDRAAFEHARLTLTLLGRTPANAGVPKFSAYLQGRTNRLTEPAAIALGRTGTDAAVATLERLAGDRRNSTLAKHAAEGLWHAPHPRARPRVATALTGTDRIAAMSAGAALVASATPGDAAVFAQGLASPNPHLRQCLLAGLPRLGREAYGVLAPAASTALAASRPRTARQIAEAIGHQEIMGRAQKALAAFAAPGPAETEPGRWLGKTKEDIETVIPGLIAGLESRSAVAGDTLITSYGAHFLRDPDDTLRFFRANAHKVVRVLVHKKYADPVGGVRLGDSADLVWERHGATDERILSWLDYDLPAGDRTLRFTYHLDAQGFVRSIDIREPEKKR